MEFLAREGGVGKASGSVPPRAGSRRDRRHSLADFYKLLLSSPRAADF
jgi:hypothetical protein